ncbi:hypothetical protein ACFT5B_15035 [Luteimicrobium sp. NPDC057192]|uniref:hypothetical protein n=1 Tax=Luteimicrobium sp. NPDC057192 TaxID=3346042 RepID=UPI003628D3E3
MREFLIRASADHGWPALPSDRMTEVLQPAGWDCEPIGGAGDFRVRAGGVEVSYSGEEIGWQVTFDADMPRAEEWIERVTRQVAAATGEPCEWLELS